jgi:DNA polymerase-3 subunit gamma/tau
VEDGALQTIAKYAMGGLRDSESILDQLTSFCREKITLGDIYDVLGVVSEGEIAGLIDSFVDKNPELAVKIFHEITENGKDVDGFIDQLLSYIRDLLLISICSKNSDLVETISRDVNLLQKQASRFSPDTLMYMIQLISETKSKARDLLQQKILLEVVLIKLATMEDLKPLGTVLNRIEDIKRSIEGNVNGGGVKEPDCGDSVGVVRNTEIRENASDGYTGVNKRDNQDANISDTWDKIMTEIQDKKRSVWVLLRDVEILNFADNEVVLEFPGNYLIHKERLEKPGEKRIIEACIEKITGKKIPVRLTISKNGRSIVTKNKDERIGNDVINDPVVKRTREIFDGSIVNIRGTE